VYSNIIPNHLQQELIQIGEDITRHTFRIGDIVILITEYVEANDMKCSKRDIWRAVGSYIGKAAGTVQGYEAIARFYPQSVRNYYEILSASHFRMAMQIDSKGEYNWQTVLDYAVDKIDDYGRPATVDELMKVFIYNSEPFEFEDEPISGVERNPVSEFINYLSDLKRKAELLPIPQYKRDEFQRVLREMERVLNSLLVEV